MAPPKTAVEQRLYRRVKQDGECLLWTGHTTGNGYGSISKDGKQVRVHRVAYELAKGPVPQGLVIDHLCRNPRCINPDHLEAVTEKVNILRGTSPSALNATKTACKHGHPFDVANTGFQRRGRLCLACNRESCRRYREKQNGVGQ